ncbi:MAG: acyl-CoA dehydrogenase family protein [Acidobacteriia bacterium]|nr:acyl-CoA dehydrogenase family protein [Terriglobia bacterium]
MTSKLYRAPQTGKASAARGSVNEVSTVNLVNNPGDIQFRMEVREFIRKALPELFPDSMTARWGLRFLDRTEVRAWTRALDSKGWAVPHWPVEWGGIGITAVRRHILLEELSAAGCPSQDAISIDFVGPVLYTFGSPQQKRRYLPRIRGAEDFWCQGFSEASAGSDVMQLKTTATRQGNHFIVTGQKLWITNAHFADMMFALVRVEMPGQRRQQGLSFLLIDMRSEGISVRPILTIDGRHHINEVVLENVKVPADNLVGEPGKGWIYARLILANERNVIAGVRSARRQLEQARNLLQTRREGGAPLLEYDGYRSRIAQMEIELDALEVLEQRTLHAPSGPDAPPSVLGPILKVRASELRQQISELAIDALGDCGLEAHPHPELEQVPTDPAALAHLRACAITAGYLFQRSATIAGGTSEVQRNIISAIGL